MARVHRIKNRSRPNTAHAIDRADTRREIKEVKAPPRHTATEQPESISKQKEWKLLYTPYPFETSGEGSLPVKGSKRRPGAEEEKSTEEKGLCRSCKKQKTCQLAKPEGGVWRCEDYE